MEKKASLPSTERDWKPKHRWREPVEQDTLRTFLLKPSRTVLRTDKQVNPFIFLTSTVSLPFWSANELSTFTHMHNTSEPNPVEICTSSGLDTRVQNFSSSLNIMTVMKIFLTAIYWSTKIVKRRKGNFLVTRNLQEGWWHFLREEGPDHPYQHPMGKMAKCRIGELFILYWTMIYFAIHPAVLYTHNLERTEPSRSMSFKLLRPSASFKDFVSAWSTEVRRVPMTWCWGV